MLTQRKLAILLLTAIGLAACKSNGPTPAEPPRSEPSPSEPSGEATNRPAHASKEATTGALPFTPPAGWESQPVSSSMRKAQFRVPGEQGDAELIIFYFGPQGAGSAEANIDRWVSQFKNPDGTPIAKAEPRRRQVNGMQVISVDVAGRYVAAMQPGAAERHDETGQRLLGAIVQTEQGPYYLKMLGPDATVAANRNGFEQLLESVQPGK